VEREKKEQLVVYRERLSDSLRCSWWSFKHNDCEKAVEHENGEHGSKEDSL